MWPLPKEAPGELEIADATLTSAEAALVGTYGLREFVAMSGQVPGGDARLTGSLHLKSSREVFLRVISARLLEPPAGASARYGRGRWRLSGDEVVFEQFEVHRLRHKEPIPLQGPWVARWKVVREGNKVLLKSGEFTYERALEK